MAMASAMAAGMVPSANHRLFFSARQNTGSSTISA
jgi:hypothetical protein